MSKTLKAFLPFATSVLPPLHSILRATEFPIHKVPTKAILPTSRLKEMAKQGGWFDLKTGSSISEPPETRLVYDTENYVLESQFPCMATATGDKSLYIWFSQNLYNPPFNTHLPLSSSFLVAHNLPFDFKKTKSNLNFEVCLFDTLSLAQHLYTDSRSHKLDYLCRTKLRKVLDKSTVCHFVEGSSKDFENSIESLVKYCLKDTIACAQIFNLVIKELAAWDPVKLEIILAILHLTLNNAYITNEYNHKDCLFPVGDNYLNKVLYQPNFNSNFSTKKIDSVLIIDAIERNLPNNKGLVTLNSIKYEKSFLLTSKVQELCNELSTSKPISSFSQQNILNCLLKLVFYATWKDISPFCTIAINTNEGIQLYVDADHCTPKNKELVASKTADMLATMGYIEAVNK